MKRFLSIILTIALLAGMLTVNAYAATTPTLKKDLSGASVTVEQCLFLGMPVEPLVHVVFEGKLLTAGEDYVVCYEHNVNAGDAVAVVIGRGAYYGSVRKTFQIEYGSGTSETLSLKGNYLGVAGGSLSENVYYDEWIVYPGCIRFVLDCNVDHVAAYQLYRIEGEKTTLVQSWTDLYGDKFDTQIEYNFSSVYEAAYKDGYAVYLLSYAWGDAQDRVYGGAMGLVIPAKVAPATSMKVEKLPDVGNYKTQYVTYYSEDGVLEYPKWSSSDTTVAEVKEGVVTFKKPGTVTVTAKCGKLSDSITLTQKAQDISEGTLTDYNSKTGKTTLYYDGYLLTEDVHYTKTVKVSGEKTQVTVTGKNLFSGQLTGEFDTCGYGHDFSAVCDPVCDRCGLTRDVTHTMSQNWHKDKENHWHFCTVCGEKGTQEAHTVLPEDPDTCTVCGELSPVGDLDGSAMLDVNDAIYLLQHVLMPSMFPVSANVDYDKSGAVDVNDAIYLLQHVLMPGMFPL